MNFSPNQLPPKDYLKKVEAFEEFLNSYNLQLLDDLLNFKENFPTELFSQYEFIYKTELRELYSPALFSESELVFNVDENAIPTFALREKLSDEICQNPDFFDSITQGSECLELLWDNLIESKTEAFLLGPELSLFSCVLKTEVNSFLERQACKNYFTEAEKIFYLNKFNSCRKNIFQSFAVREVLVSVYKRLPASFVQQKTGFLKSILSIDKMNYDLICYLAQYRSVFCYLSKIEN